MILKPAALLAAIVSLTFASAAFAADPVNIEIRALEEEPDRMVLTVSAVDENGQPFLGLDPSSFNVWINDTALIVDIEVLDGVLLRRLREGVAHTGRGLDGVDVARQQGYRQGVAPTPPAAMSIQVSSRWTRPRRASSSGSSVRWGFALNRSATGSRRSPWAGAGSAGARPARVRPSRDGARTRRPPRLSVAVDSCPDLKSAWRQGIVSRWPVKM